MTMEEQQMTMEEHKRMWLEKENQKKMRNEREKNKNIETLQLYLNKKIKTLTKMNKHDYNLINL